jgi:hypothetical protein
LSIFSEAQSLNKYLKSSKEVKMKKIIFSKVATVILIILLTLNIALNLISTNSEAQAKGKLQYKTVVPSSENISAKGFEALCNQMANDGWRYVETNNVFSQYWYTFEK